MKKIEGGITAAKGFQAAGGAAGIKKQGVKDMALVYSEVPCVAAGTFTTNIVKAAPVKWDQEIVYNHPTAQAIVCNSGIANACTGEEGYGYCRKTAEAASAALSIPEDSVLVASTGVIGKQIPIDKIAAGVEMLKPQLAATREAAATAAQAIMTTDTEPKEVAVQIEIGGKTVTIGSMCKGSGMIHPNMGTMLCFITTDCAITHEMLEDALREVVARTFNRVTVDGDTSTNDMCLALANGMAGNPLIEWKDEDYSAFLAALEELCRQLARSIAGDGEGASKLVTCKMTGARSEESAERLAKDISGWSADLFGELTAEPTQFDGYETLSEKAKVLALSDGEELVDAIATDEAGEAKDGVLVVLDRTPFYAEMGGQVADHGYLVSGDAKLKVTQVKKTPKGYFVHTCELLDGTIHVDDEVTASVDEKRRAAICRNHTATHLLQKALREVLGEHVHQAGSYQDDQITHFDFTHFSAVSPAELAEVERRVNEKIYEALPVTVKNLPIEEAKKMGAMALFGEKYGSVVRVVDAGGWSTEFCGGTHVTNTAQIGCFKILSESSVAAGIRRIEATTAFGVLDLLDDRTEILAKTAVALKANNLKDAPARAEALAAELKETAKQLEILKAQMAAAKIDGLFENAADIDGVRIVSAYLTGTGADTLCDMVDKVRDKAPNAVTVLIGSDGNKTMMAVGVSKNAMARGLKAGALVKKIAAIAGGNGGGKPDFAMAGIRDTSKIDDALNAVPEIVKAEMNQ